LIRDDSLIVDMNEPMLITGANGFIGSRVVEALLSHGFTNLRCFVRPSGNLAAMNKSIESFNNATVEVVEGNLLSVEDCKQATRGISVIFHLAAGIGKSFPGSYMNTVVTTRNLLDAAVRQTKLRRFVNISSFAVYSNFRIKRGGPLDETCAVESHLVERYEAYAFAKAKQDELLLEYAGRFNLPYVIMRPGAVYGPGKKEITGRVGINTFGFFMHLGGSNKIPFTFVDNCAEAIVLAGIKKGVDGEVFNIVDDHLPSSREFLKMYKKQVRKFWSVFVPYQLFYLFSHLWEKYSAWSQGQFPPVFNRRRCSSYWKGNTYSNEKMKNLLGWEQKVSTDEGLRRYFVSCRKAEEHA
jgi:nucleoside-diphosphate-sugar epimerase